MSGFGGHSLHCYNLSIRKQTLGWHKEAKLNIIELINWFWIFYFTCLINCPKSTMSQLPICRKTICCGPDDAEVKAQGILSFYFTCIFNTVNSQHIHVEEQILTAMSELKMNNLQPSLIWSFSIYFHFHLKQKNTRSKTKAMMETKMMTIVPRAIPPPSAKNQIIFPTTETMQEKRLT